MFPGQAVRLAQAAPNAKLSVVIMGALLRYNEEPDGNLAVIAAPPVTLFLVKSAAVKFSGGFGTHKHQ